MTRRRSMRPLIQTILLDVAPRRWRLLALATVVISRRAATSAAAVA